MITTFGMGLTAYPTTRPQFGEGNKKNKPIEELSKKELTEAVETMTIPELQKEISKIMESDEYKDYQANLTKLKEAILFKVDNPNGLSANTLELLQAAEKPYIKAAKVSKELPFQWRLRILDTTLIEKQYS